MASRLQIVQEFILALNCHCPAMSMESLTCTSFILSTNASKTIFDSIHVDYFDLILFLPEKFLLSQIHTSFS